MPPPRRAVLVQLLLHAGPRLVVDDSLVLTFVDLAAVFDPARVDDVGQQIVEAVLGEVLAARAAPGAGRPRFREPAAVIEFLHHRDQRPVFNVQREDLDNALRLLRVEHERAARGTHVIAKNEVAAHPLAPPPRGTHFVARVLGDHLAFEL